MNTEQNVKNTNIRPDFALITKWVQSGNKVLDLGCGDGGLLTHL
ncbi:MAG: methionine biosynthesis protein MetW, partial [Methylophilus sp.]